MKQATRIILVLAGTVVIGMLFQNCTTSGDNSMFQGSLGSGSNYSDPSMVSIGLPIDGGTAFAADHVFSNTNQMTVSGICNTGGHQFNIITYQLLGDFDTFWSTAPPTGSSPVCVQTTGSAPNVLSNHAIVINPAGLSATTSCPNSGTAFIRMDARCENGKFYLVIPIFCAGFGGPYFAAGQTTTYASVAVTLKAWDGGPGTVDNLGNPISPSTTVFTSGSANFASEISIDKNLSCN